MSQKEVEILKRTLARERAARKAAEQILEAKSAELYEANQKLKASNSELISTISKSNSQLQGVFETIADAYLIMDLWGNILRMNDAAVKLLGFESTEDECNLMTMVVPEEEEKVAKSFQELLTKGSIANFTLPILTHNKEVKLVHINASIIYENDQPVGAQGIVRDITLEDRYQKAIETERLKYLGIVSNMNLGLVEVNNDDEILLVNQSFEEMSGYSQDELVGRKGSTLLKADDEDNIIEIESEKRLQGVSNSYEFKAKTKDGEEKYWLVSGAPNFDIDGNVIGSIGIHLDITELKNLEKQKEELLKKLEKSNDELHEYAHIVSHDLKSPLRSIDALVTWLKEDNVGVLNETSLQNIDHIQSTLEKMEQLITDILHYSSAGSDTSENTPVNIATLVGDLLGMLYIPDNIEIKVLNDLPVVLGDKTKLQQVFQNLLSNAIKFNDKATGLIQIDVEEFLTHYQFSISDNGMGIEPKFHEKIFKVFHSLNKRKDSTGIGLSIVKKIVNLHGGEIWLESRPNEGTKFYFTIKK
ncbi:MAG: hypothetical protein Wins2KO_08000 [Winogradskyella sp.]